MQSQTFNTPFPPCLMKNCREIAPITDLCGKNINFGTGSVQGYVSFTQSPPDLVNMYNKSSVFNFQKILSRPLELYPKNVSIFDFTYYDNSGAEINENKASVYNAATGGNFSFLITLVDTTLEELTTFFEYVGSSEYETDLSDALYANGASSLQVSNVLVRFYEADPIQTSSAASYFTHSMLLLPICLMFLNMFWMF